jgi:hypothetical protein
MGIGNNIFIGMKTYKIKLEDKAALINALKKIDIGVGSYSITDNLLDGYFEVTFNSPQDEEMAKDILKTHSGIDQLKEVLRKIIRAEVKRKFGGVKNLS